MSNQQISSGYQTKRIVYIDALRGFVMFLVVINHLILFCWQTRGMGISLHDHLHRLEMPMFFFISGFMLYKANVVWTGSQVLGFLKKKAPLLLISPLVFFVVYFHVRYKYLSVYDGIVDYDKAGYWFTFVLFLYYALYAIVKLIVKNNRWSIVVLLVIGIFLCYIIYTPIYNAIPLSEDAKGFLSIANWIYFLYFVLGTVTRQYFNQFETLLDGKWFLPSCIALYFLASAYSGYYLKFIALPFTIAGVIILFSFFRFNQSYFSKGHALGRVFQYMGRRTLDIYWIHFFLIPMNLKIVTVFRDHPMPVIEATVSIVLAGIIVAFSLLIGNIIRLSPWLGHWLFGAKLPPKDTQPNTSC